MYQQGKRKLPATTQTKERKEGGDRKDMYMWYYLLYCGLVDPQALPCGPKPPLATGPVA